MSHPSLVFKKQKEKQFKETLENLVVDIEHLDRKYRELKETDLTVNTLAEFTERMNVFEQKMDTIISILSEALKPSMNESELLSYLQTELTKK